MKHIQSADFIFWGDGGVGGGGVLSANETEIENGSWKLEFVNEKSLEIGNNESKLEMKIWNLEIMIGNYKLEIGHLNLKSVVNSNVKIKKP